MEIHITILDLQDDYETTAGGIHLLVLMSVLLMQRGPDPSG